jgi:hypothetical protein
VKPAGVTVTTRLPSWRRSQSRRVSSAASAAPREPARWWRRSVQSRQERSSGLVRRAAASTSMSSPPNTRAPRVPSTQAPSSSAIASCAASASAFAAGIGAQPAARTLATRSDRLGIIGGTSAAAAGAAVGAVAFAGPDRVLAGAGAVFLGLAYGLCLVGGLHQAGQFSEATDRGAMLSCHYVLAYLGFSAPYAVGGLNEVLGQPGTFAVLAVAAAVLTGLLAASTRRSRYPSSTPAAHTWGHARS